MKHIAVVDDNQTWCFALSHLFRQRGFAVSTFEDPSRFLRVAHQFDLALIDFSIAPRRHQRDINGAELICEVKNQVESPPILVLISAFFTEEVLETAEAICPEADAYFGKAVGMDRLIQEVDRLLALREAQLAASEKAQSPSKQHSVAQELAYSMSD